MRTATVVGVPYVGGSRIVQYSPVSFRTVRSQTEPFGLIRKNCTVAALDTTPYVATVHDWVFYLTY